MQVRLGPSLLPSSLYLDHSHCLVLAPASQLRCRLPARLKLVRFPAHSPLPTAALPSMSLSPNAPFPKSRRVLCRASRALHCQVYGTRKNFSVYGSFTTDPDAKSVTSTYLSSSGR